MAERPAAAVRQYGRCLGGRVTLSSGVTYARPKLRAALLQVCTREPTQRKRLAVGTLHFFEGD